VLLLYLKHLYQYNKIEYLLKAFPLEGLRIPVIIFRTVVLPAPLCPKRQKTSFSLIDIDKLSTALKLPNFLVRL
jgi:hypothetical protein